MLGIYVGCVAKSGVQHTVMSASRQAVVAQAERRQSWRFVWVCGYRRGAADDYGIPWASLQALCQLRGVCGWRWSRQPWQPHDMPAAWDRGSTQQAGMQPVGTQSQRLTQL